MVISKTEKQMQMFFGEQTWVLTVREIIIFISHSLQVLNAIKNNTFLTYFQSSFNTHIKCLQKFEVLIQLLA